MEKRSLPQEVELDEKSKLLSEQLILPLKNKGLLEQGTDGKQQKEGLFTIFLLGIYWRFISPVNPMCVSNDSLNGIFLYQTISSQSQGN